MRFGIKEQIIMMEHENERMSYSFEPSDESSGAQGYHQTSYDPNYNQNEHKNPKKKNGVGGRIGLLQLLRAVAGKWSGSREELLRAGCDATAALRDDGGVHKVQCPRRGAVASV